MPPRSLKPTQHPTENGPGRRFEHEEVLLQGYGCGSKRLQRPNGITGGERRLIFLLVAFALVVLALCFDTPRM